MKLFKIYTIGVFLCCAATINAQSILQETVQNLKSPDGAYDFTFYQKKKDNNKQLYYTLTYKGKKSSVRVRIRGVD